MNAITQATLGESGETRKVRIGQDPLTPPAPEQIRVEYLGRVREERKFESPAALKSQILHDVSRAQAFFRRLKNWTQSA